MLAPLPNGMLAVYNRFPVLTAFAVETTGGEAGMAAQLPVIQSRPFLGSMQLHRPAPFGCFRQQMQPTGLQIVAQAGRSVRAPDAPPKESRIGKKPVQIPAGVTVTIDGQHVAVKGPLGSLERDIPELIEVSQVDSVIRLSKKKESRQANQLHGLSRSLVNNMVVGTSTGYTKVLQLIGVGYRAAVTGGDLTLNLGYSHPVVLKIPAGLKVAVEKNTTVTITGFDKEQVGQFAATVRDKRPPEPYKGKGVRYANEFVRRKEGKKGK